jgi:hypothetical protein
MSRRGRALLLPAALLLLAGCAARPRLRPFTTDGCSLFPDGTAHRKDLWLHCCEAHDHRYWMGGSEADRREADLALRACVAAEGQPQVADWMLRGTRAGGTPYLPTGFRWGYGWRYLRGYEPLTDEEKKLISESKSR